MTHDFSHDTGLYMYITQNLKFEYLLFFQIVISQMFMMLWNK